MFPLESHITVAPPALSQLAPCIEVDASPWGGGAALRIPPHSYSEYFELSWSQEVADHLGATIGESSSQTTFEYLVILLALVVWMPSFPDGARILGDNVSALHGVLHLRGRADLSKITREIAWRKARFAWRFAVGHLPTEANTVADALSRLAAPASSEQKHFPSKALRDARERRVDFADVWACTW